MKKRILSLVLTVAMLVSVLAMVSASASAECNVYEYGCDHDVVGDLLRLYRVRCGCTSTYTCIYHRDYYNRLNCHRRWDSSTSDCIYPCRNDNTWFTATVSAYGMVAGGRTVGDTYYTTVSDYTDWANISVGPATVNGKNVTYSIQRADRRYWCRDYDLVNGNNGSFWLEDGRNVFKVTATVDGAAPVAGSISIVPSELTLKVGESATIEAVLKNLPVDGKVSWETEGKKFVSINAQNPLKPTVYGDKAGVENVKITYTYAGVTYTATCKVTVVEPTVEPDPGPKPDDPKPVEPKPVELELKLVGKNDKTKAANVKLCADGQEVDKKAYSIEFNPANAVVTKDNENTTSNVWWFRCNSDVESVEVRAEYNGQTSEWLEVKFESVVEEEEPHDEEPVDEEPIEEDKGGEDSTQPVDDLLLANGLYDYSYLPGGNHPGAPEAPKCNTYTFYVVIDRNYEKTLPTYTITTECSVGGKVSNDEITVRRGDDATIKFTANAGYAVSSVVVDGVEQGAITSYTFKDVVKNHKVKVTFMPVEIIPEAPVIFSDLPATHWAYTYVQSLVNAGIINGYEDGTFRPNNSVTWGEALKLVLRVAGYSEQAAPVGEYWATGYMNLAISQGILADVVDLRAPIDRLSMAQLAAKALELSAPTVASPFADCSDASVVALYESGIITGSSVAGGTVYNPDSSLTRAEFAAIIYRMRELG